MKSILIGLIIILLMIIAGLYFYKNTDSDKYALSPEEEVNDIETPVNTNWEEALDDYLSQYLSLFSNSETSEYIKWLYNEDIDDSFKERDYGKDYYFIDPLTQDRIFPEDIPYITLDRDGYSKIAVSFELVDLTNNSIPDILITWEPSIPHLNISNDEFSSLVTLHTFTSGRYQQVNNIWDNDPDLMVDSDGNILLFNYEEYTTPFSVDKIIFNSNYSALTKTNLFSVTESVNGFEVRHPVTNELISFNFTPDDSIQEAAHNAVSELLDTTLSNINRLDALTNQIKSSITNELKNQNLIK